MPAQPGMSPPAGTQPGRGRRYDGRPREARPGEARGRRSARRGPGGWGALQGGLGVCIIVASAALGAIATMVTRREPGVLLGLFVIAGTVAAALAVRPRMGRMILPVPVLAYLVGALTSGIVFNRAAGSSGTALAIGAAQWIANGFFAMVLATVLAVSITAGRWFLWRRRRPAAREPGWPPRPAATGPPVPPRPPRAARETTAEPAYPARQGRRPEPRPGTWRPGTPPPGASRPGAPRSGTGPYNFSSGA
jgi:uncharacterized protein DUF6542